MRITTSTSTAVLLAIGFGFNASAQVPVPVAVPQPVETAQPVRGVSMDEAKKLYEKGKYSEAVPAFYGLLASAKGPEVRGQIHTYLAESLSAQKLHVPALYYFTKVFRRGKKTPYYLQAVSGLLKTQEALRDPVFVPNLLNKNLDPQSFATLKPEEISQINFLVGELFFRQRKLEDAKRFLTFVPEGSLYNVRARVLLGLIAAGKGGAQEAQSFFAEAGQRGDDLGDEGRRLANLARIQAARVSYGAGDYEGALAHYSSVSRYSEEWFQALYERAWAHFQERDYGRALGDVQSVSSPYFKNRHLPEAYVITATAYFAHCQWDRVKRDVKVFQDTYGTMATELKSYLDGTPSGDAVYEAVVASGGGRFSDELAREVRRQRRFKDYHFMIRHVDWEKSEIAKKASWTMSGFSEEVGKIMAQQADTLRKAAGRWARSQLKARYASLKNFSDQINIIDFEVSDAETKWLEQGREVEKGERDRVARPSIPNDQWQHWNYDGEFWKGEIGYIVHALAVECNEDDGTL